MPLLLSALSLLVLVGGPAPDWQRAWVAESFICAACSPEDRQWLTARLGQTVLLAPDRFLNPFYEDCTSGADYSDLMPRSRAEALRHFRGVTVVAERPISGLVRCASASGPPNIVARLLIEGDRALLLHESGAVLQLR
ncbi:hypothetical protein ACVFYP_07270 [Roseomonas sp. F4]